MLTNNHGIYADYDIILATDYDIILAEYVAYLIAVTQVGSLVHCSSSTSHTTFAFLAFPNHNHNTTSHIKVTKLS